MKTRICKGVAALFLLLFIPQSAFAFDMQDLWNLGFNAMNLIAIVAAVLFIIAITLILLSFRNAKSTETIIDDNTIYEPKGEVEKEEPIEEVSAATYAEDKVQQDIDAPISLLLEGINIRENLTAAIDSSITVGRKSDNDLVITDTVISGMHCSIERRDGKLFLRDDNSTNGTFVNDIRIHGETELMDGCTLQLGTRKYMIRINP